jgi:hypothetical protein
MTPIRVQLSRKKGWRMPPNTVSVARPTLWSNPFVIGEPSGCDFNDGGDPTPLIGSLSRQQAIDLFRDMVSGWLSPEMHPHGHRWMSRFKKATGNAHPAEYVSILRGKNLACWCKPGEPCHADVLLELANR